MKKTKKIKQFLWLLGAVFILLIASTSLQAQPTDPDPTPSSAIPIDGGVSMLIAAGAAYGISKLKRKE